MKCNSRSNLPFAKNQGFTLIEIMVVVVIIGILGAAIVPNLIGRPDEVRVTAALVDIAKIGTTLDLYRLDNGVYPSTDQGLQALVTEPSGFPEARRWNADGYLKSVPKDPWGEEYLYFSEDRNYEVYSFGADRKEGGEGTAKDLSSADLN